MDGCIEKDSEGSDRGLIWILFWYFLEATEGDDGTHSTFRIQVLRFSSKRPCSVC
jgi:hypothetical protein